MVPTLKQNDDFHHQSPSPKIVVITINKKVDISKVNVIFFGLTINLQDITNRI